MRLKSNNICWLFFIALLRITTAAFPKEIVESNLNSLFGFKGRPKIDRSKIVVPSEMMEMYEKLINFPLDTTSIPKQGLHTKTANTIRSFIHQESRIDDNFKNHHRFRLKFDVSSIPKSEFLKAAELKLTRQALKELENEILDAGKHYQHILVHEIMQPGIKNKQNIITRVIDSKVVYITENSSISLDVLPAVQRWIEEPHKNHGIIVTVKGNPKTRHVRLRRDVSSEDEASWNTMRPILYTYTDDGRYKPSSLEDMVANNKRPKRATKKNRKKDEKREQCRRHSMFVDFSEVGWSDWIVAPPGYDAYYCAGECNYPIPEHLNTTNHAIVQTLMNSVNPNTVPKSCCVPTQLSTITMLYLDDEEKVVLKNYKEMQVTGCGCR